MMIRFDRMELRRLDRTEEREGMAWLEEGLTVKDTGVERAVVESKGQHEKFEGVGRERDKRGGE